MPLVYILIAFVIFLILGNQSRLFGSHPKNKYKAHVVSRPTSGGDTFHCRRSITPGVCEPIPSNPIPLRHRIHPSLIIPVDCVPHIPVIVHPAPTSKPQTLKPPVKIKPSAPLPPPVSLPPQGFCSFCSSFGGNFFGQDSGGGCGGGSGGEGMYAVRTMDVD